MEARPGAGKAIAVHGRDESGRKNRGEGVQPEWAALKPWMVRDALPVLPDPNSQMAGERSRHCHSGVQVRALPSSFKLMQSVISQAQSLYDFNMPCVPIVLVHLAKFRGQCRDLHGLELT